MKRQTRKKLLNHNSPWKYGVLIVTIIVMLLSALPSLFGEDAAIEVSDKAGLSVSLIELHKQLQLVGIDIKRIEQADGQTLIVLAKQAQQTQTKQLLAKLVAKPEHLTLALAPAAPSWLLSLGVAPIKLGLDLRGGVQFLLDVDLEPVYRLHGESLVDSIKQFSREQKLMGTQVRYEDDDIITLVLANSETSHQYRQFLRSQHPRWQVKQDGDGILTVSLKQTEKDLLRDLTVKQNLQTMRSRISQLGITEAVVQRQGEHRIRIELPGVQDPAAAKSVIGATASLAFYEVKPPGSVNAKILRDDSQTPVYVSRKPVLGGEHIIDARAGIGEMGGAEVNISLDSAGGKLMSAFSRDNIGPPMATSYSEYRRNAQGEVSQQTRVISIATIQSQLGNRFSITGAGDYQEAQQLALLLRAGSMTAPVTIVEERTIGPSLGAENIVNGFAALALGMAMTLVFMGFWYRRLGWVANVALIANMVILFGLLALIPGAVLTLPGIAGLVLTVGMAVDTNVLIFERIKDNLKLGRDFAHAIDRGFDSAFGTILDANFTTMITAVVLYSIGNGPIQGFALTLGLGLLTSMFTGIFASRALINWAYGRNFNRDVRV